MTMRVLGSILLSMGLSSLAWAADSSTDGGCSAPTVIEPASAVDVPQYAEGDDVPDPSTDARARAFAEYQRQVISSLKASSDPRDWAVAVTMDFGLPSAADHAEKVALLRRAATASPNDVLAQWVVMAGARRLNATDLVAEAVDRLTQIEPDNAAVWMEILQRQAMRHDRAGVTAALAHMSTTSRMDNHFADLTKLVAEALQRTPMPEDSEYSRSEMPYVFMTVAAASALPAYQFLTTACAWDSTGRNADRASDCEHIGRVMSQQGDTLLTQAIGFVVLRVSRTFNDDDVEAARQMDWVFQNYSDITALNPGRVDIRDEMHEAQAYHKDWVEAGSETEAMRRRIVRAGLSPTPPESWVGKAPRFSPERIQQDEATSAEKLAKAAY